MNQVGVGIVGAGEYGEVHAMAYSTHPQAKLVAICDVNEKRAQALADRFGATSYYTSYERLLQDESIQAISIVTPDPFHKEIAVAAAQAGKHILVEKPLATTVEEADAIVSAAEKAGVNLMVDFNAHWCVPFVLAKEAIAAGKIGKVVHGYARLSNTLWVPRNLIGEWSSKSSALWFLGSHWVDLLRWLLNDEVSRVYAVSRSIALREKGINAPDFHQSVLEFKKGPVVVMENSWILPDSEPAIVDSRLDLFGSKGAISVDNKMSGTLKVFTEDKAEYPELFAYPSIHGRPKGYAIDAIHHFVDCVAGKGRLLVTGRDGLEVTKVLVAILKSVETGQPVAL